MSLSCRKGPVQNQNIKTIGLENSMKRLFRDEYAFIGGDRVLNMITEDVIRTYKDYSHDPWNLEVGQILWFARSRFEKPGPAKSSADIKKVPVILSIVHEDDLKMKNDGFSAKEIRVGKIVRIINEAYEQEAVLTQSDIALVLGICEATVSNLINEYQKKNKTTLKYCGMVLDIGPSLTHKKEIIRMFLQNVPTPDISRRMNHTEDACDRYIKSFKKVQMLYNSKMEPTKISLLLDMSERLVVEYIEIIKEHSLERS